MKNCHKILQKIFQILFLCLIVLESWCVYGNIVNDKIFANGNLYDVKFKNSNITKTKGLIIEDMWARPTMGKNRNTAIYFRIINESENDRILKSAKIDSLKGRVELHDSFVDENGISRMRSVDNLVIPKGGAIELKPGGTHIMVIGMDRLLEIGDKFFVELSFSDGYVMVVQCLVKGT